MFDRYAKAFKLLAKENATARQSMVETVASMCGKEIKKFQGSGSRNIPSLKKASVKRGYFMKVKKF